MRIARKEDDNGDFYFEEDEDGIEIDTTVWLEYMKALTKVRIHERCFNDIFNAIERKEWERVRVEKILNAGEQPPPTFYPMIPLLINGVEYYALGMIGLNYPTFHPEKEFLLSTRETNYTFFYPKQELEKWINENQS